MHCQPLHWQCQMDFRPSLFTRQTKNQRGRVNMSFSFVYCPQIQEYLDTINFVLQNKFHRENLNLMKRKICNILIQRGEYAEVTRTRNLEKEISLQCSCETYRVLLVTAQQEFGDINWDGISCIHCRFIKELFDKVGIVKCLVPNKLQKSDSSITCVFHNVQDNVYLCSSVNKQNCQQPENLSEDICKKTHFPP